MRILDRSAGNIFKNAFVGRWFAAFVMMFWKPVHRNRDAEAGNFHPLGWNRDYPARNHHREDIHFAESRNNAAQFAMANHRLASDQRHVQRTVAAHQFDYTFD